MFFCYCSEFLNESCLSTCNLTNNFFPFFFLFSLPSTTSEGVLSTIQHTTYPFFSPFFALVSFCLSFYYSASSLCTWSTFIHHLSHKRTRVVIGSHTKHPNFLLSTTVALFTFDHRPGWIRLDLLAFFIDESNSLRSAVVLSIMMALLGILTCWIDASLAVFLSMRALFAILAYWISSSLLILSSMRAFFDDLRLMNSFRLWSHICQCGPFFFNVESIEFGSTVHFHSYKYCSFSSSNSKR